MPLHVFHCGDCQRSSELLIHASEQAPATCPHCGSEQLTREFSTFAVGSSSASSSPPPMPCQMAAGGGCAGGMCPMMN